jgi:hypothetical protein
MILSQSTSTKLSSFKYPDRSRIQRSFKHFGWQSIVITRSTTRDAGHELKDETYSPFTAADRRKKEV